MKINMNKPASRWTEGFPLGNGFFGTMIYGGTDKEIIDLSANTWFSGNIDWDANCPDNADIIFQQMRTEAIKENYESVRELTKEYMGRRLNYGTNLPLAQIVIKQENSETSVREVTSYNRSLDLKTGLCQASWNQQNNIKRECFLSHTDNVLAVRMKAEYLLPDISFKISGDGIYSIRFDNLAMSTDYSEQQCCCELELHTKAREEVHSDGRTGTDGVVRIRLLSQGGQFIHNSEDNGEIRLCGSTGYILLLTVVTNHESDNPVSRSQQIIEGAVRFDWAQLRSRHISDFSPAMDRVTLRLGANTKWDKPADKTVQELSQSTDENVRQGLVSLMFQFGRYLLHSSSRSDSPLPAHLQGIWNDSVASRIGWTCDMHLDINTQMNYWPAELTALSESIDPLLDWLQNYLVPSGRITAKKCYGLDGWAAELVSNAWGYSAPYWSPSLSPCPTGGAWLVQQLWQRYMYNKNTLELTDRILPIIYESALFFSQYLFEFPDRKYLQSGPSISPENTFIAAGGKYNASLSPTYEITVIRDIFSCYLTAIKEPAVDMLTNEKYELLAQTIRQQFGSLPPFKIASDGTISEWSHNFPAADKQHRHTSHLLGLFPYRQITPERTPELAKAAQATLQQRLTPSDNWEDTGWSRALLMLYSASLKQGNEAYNHIVAMLNTLLQPTLLVKHPPTRGAPSFDDVYEMDGNTGLTTCIAHMLLQSAEDGIIEILPALPETWLQGEAIGLRASGDVSTIIKWHDGRLKEVALTSSITQSRIIKYKEITVKVQLIADTPCKVSF